MKRLVVLGLLGLGISALGLAQGPKGPPPPPPPKKGPVQMPEGTAYELPYFILGAAALGLWGWHRSKTRKGMGPDRV